MDIPRGSSIALPFLNSKFHQGRHRRLSRSNSQTSSESGLPGASMAIPGARINDVPPALPPPRYIHDLDDGVDIAWIYQNEDLDQSRLAPIKPGSSLLGHRPCTLQSGEGHEDIDVDMDIDDVPSALQATRSSSQSHLATRSSIPSLTRRPPSSSGINQRLHGENPLAQQSHHQSTHAYDKHLLLKIGKSNSPSGHLRSASRDKNKPSQKLSIQTRGPILSARPPREAISALDSVTNRVASPIPAISPSSKGSWREHSINSRSPSDSISLSLGADLELYQTRTMYSKPRVGSSQGSEDTRTRSERGSYDSAMSAGDTESTYEDTATNSLRFGERSHLSLHHGTKRRALSPPLEISHGQRSGPLPLRLPSATVTPNITPRQPYRAGSVASTSSNHHSSCASSALLSNGSSLTSMSSIETPTSLDFSPRVYFTSPINTLSSPGVPITPSGKGPHASAASKMSLQMAMNESQPFPPRIGNHYICSCCPKKPRKFETEENLRNHESEKQYACAYCNNRFKNKNEAERHQNSLHLRKQSWSCAVISSYQAAFYPTAFSNPRNLSTDTCGFCGEEFANQPPNWEERIEHLINTHKFGECNSYKKFYRADHFRQHLKHSHAGKSGKWTNILENSCQREEVLSEPTSLSPTASERSQSGSSCQLQGRRANPADASMDGVETFDEAHEEL